MAYRDARDPRIDQLKALLASEPKLIEQRTQLRRETDRLQGATDALGAELGERARPGLLAKLLGRTTDLSAEQRQHDEMTARLERLIAEELAVAAQLESLGDARRELAELEAARVETMRATEGPIGDELRALDGGIAMHDQLIDALRETLGHADRAHSVAIALGEMHDELRQVSQTSSVVMSVLMDQTGVGHAATVRSRIATQAIQVEARMRDLVAAIDTLRVRDPRWHGDPQLLRLRTQLATHDVTDMQRDGRTASQITTNVLTRLGGELRQLQQRRDELDANRRTFVGQTR